MNTITQSEKLAAQRALNELSEQRAADDWAGDTAMLPALQPPIDDETVPMLPALVRPQAE